MRRHLIVLTCLAVAIASACSPATTPAPSASPSSVAVAQASASPAPSVLVASPSPSPAATPSPTVSPSPTPTVAPTPAPTPVPWKTYKSARYHYSIKYPPGWIVTPGTSKLADQFDNYGYPYIYASRDTVSGIASISLTVASTTAYYKSHNKAKLISSSKIRIAGWAGKVLQFDGTENGLKVRIQVVILAKGSVGYLLWVFGDRTTAAADAALFKKMYNTWRAR